MFRYVTALCAATAISWGTMMQAEMLPGSEWGPTELNAEAFEPAAEIFLRFEQDGRYFGNSGCNTFRGSFVTNGNSILFGPGAATRMACPEPVSSQETAFLNALMQARSFERDGITLSLSDAAGTPLLTFQQRDAD
jgi:heat shock protein HslJ